MTTAFYAIVAPDGAVHGAGACAEEVLPLQQATQPGGQIVQVDEALFRIIDTDLDGYRLAGGEVVPREAMTPTLSSAAILADGVDEAVLGGLPIPCRVTVGGVARQGPLVVEDGEVVLTSTTPGAITIRVEAPPDFRPWEAIIRAA